ncbi:uncharacterized protein ALTATR162_LOCUS4 [Alternaria atra]|uniref:MACPF-like domain-containing protein n=1 Tax=Alternaria atra TaxID=119953 RepID=A0A8J2HUP5_9PLEO|nr:uncharacterized protein ALTATR162_LOCUS4 [Alternaria atra]CAG5136910.1 unnamed protein product [Alternaria atra]
MLDSISKGELVPGKLPTFSDKNLAALSGSYATNAGSKAYLEPGDLDGTQWDAVFKNNRILTGYYYQWSGANDAKPILVKARKPAFNLRGAAPVGVPSTGGSDSTQVKVPAIPPFYIDDDATVSIVEIRTQFQHTLIKEGFDSVAVGGSLGGGAASIPATITASFEKEHSTVSSTSTSMSVDSLVATYNFPRVVVELDPECLVLTDECRADAMHITDDASQARFFRTYGKIFVTKFTLGGYLHSTRNISSKEQSSLEQVKDRTRIAAGLSIQTPKASGGINVAKVESTGTETGVASLLQDAHLTWNARGGDTLLCSNPPAWANTVKDYKLWRLMNQHRLVTLDGLIKDVDVVAWRKIDQPSIALPPSGDILKDHEQIRVTLLEALIDPDNNSMAQAIENYYWKNKYDQGTNIDKYDTWMRSNFPADKDSLIKAGTGYGSLSNDQKIFRSERVIKNHWRDAYSWSPAEKGGRLSGVEQKKIQDRVNKNCKNIHCQRLLVQGQGSQYFEVHQPGDSSPDVVPVNGDAAWAQVGEEMARAWANIETRAQNTIQEGERDEVNPWLERTQWLPYLVGMERPELMACIEEPVAELEPRGRHGDEQRAEPSSIDEMEAAQDTAANAIVEPTKLSRLQKACLAFCIALLNQSITRKEYDSPLVCALAVLGVKEDGWKGAEQYPPVLSAVIKVARFMVVQQALELSGPLDEDELDDSAYESDSSGPRQRQPKGCLQFVQEMMDRFMVRGSHGPMQWMLDLRTYGLKIHYNTTSRGHVEWTGGDELLYKGLQFNMAQFRGMVHGLVTESRRLLMEELMFSSSKANLGRPSYPVI